MQSHSQPNDSPLKKTIIELSSSTDIKEIEKKLLPFKGKLAENPHPLTIAVIHGNPLVVEFLLSDKMDTFMSSKKSLINTPDSDDMSALCHAVQYEDANEEKVSEFKEKRRKIISLLIKHGASEWTYQFEKPNGKPSIFKARKPFAEAMRRKNLFFIQLAIKKRPINISIFCHLFNLSIENQFTALLHHLMDHELFASISLDFNPLFNNWEQGKLSNQDFVKLTSAVNRRGHYFELKIAEDVLNIKKLSNDEKLEIIRQILYNSVRFYSYQIDLYKYYWQYLLRMIDVLVSLNQNDPHVTYIVGLFKMIADYCRYDCKETLDSNISSQIVTAITEANIDKLRVWSELGFVDPAYFYKTPDALIDEHLRQRICNYLEILEMFDSLVKKPYVNERPKNIIRNLLQHMKREDAESAFRVGSLWKLDMAEFRAMLEAPQPQPANLTQLELKPPSAPVISPPQEAASSEGQPHEGFKINWHTFPSDDLLTETPEAETPCETGQTTEPVTTQVSCHAAFFSGTLSDSRCCDLLQKICVENPGFFKEKPNLLEDLLDLVKTKTEEEQLKRFACF